MLFVFCYIEDVFYFCSQYIFTPAPPAAPPLCASFIAIECINPAANSTFASCIYQTLCSAVVFSRRQKYYFANLASFSLLMQFSQAKRVYSTSLWCVLCYNKSSYLDQEIKLDLTIEDECVECNLLKPNVEVLEKYVHKIEEKLELTEMEKYTSEIDWNCYILLDVSCHNYMFHSYILHILHWNEYFCNNSFLSYNVHTLNTDTLAEPFFWNIINSSYLWISVSLVSLFLIPYPLCLMPYALSLIPYPLSLIPYPLSLIPYPKSLIPYPLSLIHYPLSLIPYP